AETEGAETERVDARDALRAIRNVDGLRQVVEKNAHDLAEAERDDRKVVAAQFERGRAEQHTEQAGDERADGQDDPERQVQIEMRRGEQGVHIRAHRIEGNVSQVEQPGE